ncbi:MAG: hypothetical protein P9M14_05335 [Candidatus Alcyoniella australis]|nr:hypothetical protein [Candidatus Alcyoniella australis]
MKKLIVILVILAFIFALLAAIRQLPEPVQTYVDQKLEQWFPAKDKLENQRDNYLDQAQEASD